jgi:hypothetical protein
MRLRDLHQKLIERFGPIINLRENPGILDEIDDELGAPPQSTRTGTGAALSAAPFGVSWMDSWVAHWIYDENLRRAQAQDKELARVLSALVDLKFNERLQEMQRFIRDYPGRVAEPPDGGTPEPGVPPPSGPAGFDPVAEPPDAGPPEPGVPPDPSPGPQAGFLRENPWILYWFVSIKAPVLLDMIDAHMTRRLHDLRGRGTP